MTNDVVTNLLTSSYVVGTSTDSVFDEDEMAKLMDGKVGDSSRKLQLFDQ